MMFNWRNAVRRGDGYDCEVEHPALGWMPHTVVDGSGDAEMQALWDALEVVEIPDAALPPPPVPQSVTDIQFALACVSAGLMTAQEAEDWVGAGVLPSGVTAALAAITDPQTLAAVRIRIRGARVIERSNLVIDLLQQHLGLTSQQVDAVFVAAAAL